MASSNVAMTRPLNGAPSTVATLLPAGVVSVKAASPTAMVVLLVPTVLAYYLNAWALSRVPPSTVAVYIYLQPLIAFALAPIMLGESFGLRAVVASLLIFAGVLIVTRRSSIKAAERVEAFKSV